MYTFSISLLNVYVKVFTSPVKKCELQNGNILYIIRALMSMLDTLQTLTKPKKSVKSNMISDPIDLINSYQTFEFVIHLKTPEDETTYLSNTRSVDL